MSTRGVIARIGKNEGEFSGRYTHSDSMPMTRGPLLWHILHDEFKGDLKEMLGYLIDEHKAGWSSLFPDSRSCYCHPEKAQGRPEFKGRKAEPAHTVTHADAVRGDTDLEWAYIFDLEQNRMFVRDIRHDAEFIVDLGGPEPSSDKWTEIECGGEAENWARCSHYAWYHNLLPKTSNLSTQTWLGNRPLDFHDAVAFVISGKRWASTGCGGNSDYYNRNTATRWPSNAWIASVKARNGKRIDAAVAKITKDGYTPLPGITWIMPPTKNNPTETMVSA
jgi:hypothetical protein